MKHTIIEMDQNGTTIKDCGTFKDFNKALNKMGAIQTAIKDKTRSFEITSYNETEEENQTMKTIRRFLENNNITYNIDKNDNMGDIDFEYNNKMVTVWVHCGETKNTIKGYLVSNFNKPNTVLEMSSQTKVINYLKENMQEVTK